MILKTIKFKNYAGEEEVGTFHFNLSKGELVKMQMSAIDHRTESFEDKLEKIGSHLNGKALIEVIDEIIDVSYGVKTTDGKRFIKNAADLEYFKSTEAYSELVVELCTDAVKASEFVNGLVPADLRAEVQKEVAQTQAKSTYSPQDVREQSLAAKGGFNQKQEAPKSTVQQVPELPTVIEGTADPVLESAPNPTPEKIDMTSMSREDLEAALAARGQ
jgi:hypothetical protein